MAKASWQDYKVYLADDLHKFPDASDEPAASADYKNLAHELAWIKVNGGDLSMCPKQAVLYYTLDANLNKVRATSDVHWKSDNLAIYSAIAAQKHIDWLAADARALQALHIETTDLKHFINDTASKLELSAPIF